MKTVITSVLILMISIFGGSYLFNHINCWLGIIFFIVGISFLINYIHKQIKQNKNNEKQNS